MTNPLLIGADVHRDTNTICFMDRQGREVAPRITLLTSTFGIITQGEQ